MGDIADDLIEDSINGIDRFESRKYYIVWKGKVPGIYLTWAECNAQINKFPGARYKSFTCDYQDAERLYQSGLHDVTPSNSQFIAKSIAVDASCLTNPGPMEYRGKNVETGNVIFSFGPVPNGTNNIGEFLAIVHALALMKKENNDLPIYSDSATAIKWVQQKRANTTLIKNKSTQQIYDLIERAEKWLRENQYSNKVLKWETHLWKEIPADYGRKK